MSVRHGLLALLAQGPRYGYQLRTEFEEVTGSTWPLNIGQVYTTLGRLERDGLVVPTGSDAEGRVVYRITEAGEDEVQRWFATAVSSDKPPRDELVIKLAFAVTTPNVDPTRVVQAQRSATVRALQELTRLKREQPSDPSELTPEDRAWTLVREAMIFQREAEVRWLDHCESYVALAAGVSHNRPAANQRAAETSQEARS